MNANTEQLYHFDVLPLHPRPKPLETLTSYLANIAVANGIHTMVGLSRICFPGKHANTIAVGMVDRPLEDYGHLPIVTLCPEAMLDSLTFFPLVKKFGRSGHPNVASRFLGEVVDSKLRYCPVCLTENLYYRLPWRFKTLQGCVHHQCFLLERCCHCDEPIPLLCTPFDLDKCPTCAGDLRTCVAPPLSEAELQVAVQCNEDLEFLLIKQPWEMTSLGKQLIGAIGPQLAYHRKRQGKTLEMMADVLEKKPDLVSAIERANHNRRATFNDYLNYVVDLGIGWQDLFDIKNLPQFKPLDEDKLVTQILQIKRGIETRGGLVSQQAISDATGMPLHKLSSFPKVKVILDDISCARRDGRARQVREEVFLKQVETIIANAQVANIPITFAFIREKMNRSRTFLYGYPRIKSLIQRYIESSHNAEAYRQREDHWFQAVLQAEKDLELAGQPVSVRAIAQLLGRSINGLRNYARVRVLLDEIAQKHKDVERKLLASSKGGTRADAVVAKVQTAISELSLQEESLTWKRIGQHVGLTPSVLRTYIQVREIIGQALEEQRVNKIRMLRDEVHTAIEMLENSKTPITQKAISDIVGLKPKALRRYPEIAVILDQVVAEKQVWTIKAYQEVELLSQVQNTVTEIRAQKGKVSPRDVVEALGIPNSTLRSYPKVRFVLLQLAEEDRANRRKYVKEDIWLEEVKSVVQALEAADIPTTQTNISEQVGMSIAGLMYYPRIAALLKEIADKRRHQH